MCCDLQLFYSLPHSPATWRGPQLRWQWGSDPSTPERLGWTASASFRCLETPQVSMNPRSWLQRWKAKKKDDGRGPNGCCAASTLAHESESNMFFSVIYFHYQFSLCSLIYIHKLLHQISEERGTAQNEESSSIWHNRSYFFVFRDKHIRTLKTLTFSLEIDNMLWSSLVWAVKICRHEHSLGCDWEDNCGSV